MTQTLSSKYRAAVLLALAAAALLLGGGRQAYAAFPGTNGDIVYESAVTGNSEIFVMSADGSGKTNLTNDLAGPGRPEDRDPAWSPDGDRIAFARPSEGHLNVYVMNADGSERANLTPGAVTTGAANDGIEPTWSPAGTMIAFNSAGNVWIMFANGGGKTNLTGPHRAAGDGGPANGNAPAWSPDGTKIAYGRDGNIWVMNADGGAPTQLTTSDPGAGAFRPDWSPDGTKITYDGDDSVWVMNADGSDQTRLLNGSRPAWSPDGTKIVFDSNGHTAPNGHDIFVMNADGTGLERLDMPVPASDLDPSWQRIASLPTDTTPPVLSLPISVAADATSPEGAVVTYSATATDDTDPSPNVTCTPPSGATFPIGETTVACTAVDASGNQAAGSFAVIVSEPIGEPPIPPLVRVANELAAIVAANPGTPLADKVEDVLAKVETALRLLAQVPSDREGALGALEGAVGDLESAVKDGLLTVSEGTSLMARISSSEESPGTAREFADAALSEALERDGDDAKIAEARRAIADGDSLRASGRFKDAIAKYTAAAAKAADASGVLSKPAWGGRVMRPPAPHDYEPRPIHSSPPS